MWLIILLILPLAGMVYVSWHVWTLLPLPDGWKWLIIALGVLCFLSLFLVFGRTMDKLPLPLARVLYQVGTSSVFILLYLAMLFLLLDLGSAVHLVPAEWLRGNWAITGCVTGAMLAIFLLGNIHYHNKTRVSLDLTTSKPLAKDYTIVMASDLHLGYHNIRSTLARWVDMINAEHPDLVLLAGDIVDISVRPLLEEDMAEEFKRIEAPVYTCLGNHEYYSHTPQARKFCEEAHIQVLCDTSVLIDSTLLVIGRDDRTNPHRKTVETLLKQSRPHSALDAESPFTQSYTILLDHQPYDLNLSEEAGVDFQFSGHTHYGQVWPVSWITNALYECAWGEHRRGATRYYVSSGLGIWGGKFRIGTRSEYVVATLKTNTL